MEEERRTLKNWARGHSCDIVAKNLASFCSYSETLTEVKYKDNGQICLAEDISQRSPLCCTGRSKECLEGKTTPLRGSTLRRGKFTSRRKPIASPISWEVTSQESVPSAHRGRHSCIQRGEAVNRTWLLSMWYLIWSHQDVSMRGSLRTAEARPCVAQRQSLW